MCLSETVSGSERQKKGWRINNTEHIFVFSNTPMDMRGLKMLTINKSSGQTTFE